MWYAIMLYIHVIVILWATLITINDMNLFIEEREFARDMFIQRKLYWHTSIQRG